MTTRKILIELDLEISGPEETSGGNYIVELTHPDLKGSLWFESSSNSIIETVITSFDQSKGKALPQNPFESLVESAAKLSENINDLRVLLKK